MTAPTSGPARLGWFVKQRRTQKRLSQAAAARLAGISRPVWSNVEAGIGTSYETTYAGVEEALDWTLGSSLRTLAGGEPDIDEPEDTGELILVPATREKIAAALVVAADQVKGLEDYEEGFLRAIAAKIRAQDDEARGSTRASG